MTITCHNPPLSAAPLLSAGLLRSLSSCAGQVLHLKTDQISIPQWQDADCLGGFIDMQILLLSTGVGMQHQNLCSSIDDSSSKAAVVLIKLQCEWWLSLRALQSRIATNLLSLQRGKGHDVKYTSRKMRTSFLVFPSLSTLFKQRLFLLNCGLLLYNEYQYRNK